MNRLLMLIFGLVVALPAAGQGRYAPIVELDRIVAVVNKDVIVESELRDRVRQVRGQLRESGTVPPDETALTRQVLERLVLERLQLQVAQSNRIRVDDAELTRALEQIASRNQLTLRQFRDVLERDGFDFGRFREQVRNEILLGRVRQRSVERRVKVTPREIDNFLATADRQGGGDNQYRLGHILIAVPEAASADDIDGARAEVGSVLERLGAGEDFAQIAAEVSDGQQALRGGDLGWRKGSELPTIFAEQVSDMQPGDVRGPIRSPSGFHVVRLHEVRGDSRFVVTQTHARHILVTVNDLVSDEEAQRRLAQLKVRIQNGEPFDELARSHSDDTVSATRGGDLGWLNPGDTVPNFERAMKTLPEGEVSDPFRTQFGWHVLQVLGRRQHDDTDQVRRARAAEQIRARKLDEEVQTWLRQLRDEAYVELRLDE
jgi:peptidyl-prolyl cis-trans isomerase SurA